MKKYDFTNEEKIIAEAIFDARKVQEYIWQELSFRNQPFNTNTWSSVFQKRVDKIAEINSNNPAMKVELRKRVLQQAALSIAALKLLDTMV